MIRSLSGSVSYHTPKGVIVDVHGVGYLVAVPLRSLPRVGSDVMLFIHHHIREDTQALYGFQTLHELELFERLLEVNSIGPKSALGILSVATSDEIAKAVESGDQSFFTRVPGLGKKSALKILVELKGKLLTSGEAEFQNSHHELIEALESLGYQARDVEPIARDIPSDLTDLQSQLTWVLKNLIKR